MENEIACLSKCEVVNSKYLHSYKARKVAIRKANKKKSVGPKKVSLTQLLLLIIRNMFVIRYTFVITFVPDHRRTVKCLLHILTRRA